MIKRHMYVLAVPDLARSSEFYRDVLGFDIQEMAPGWLSYVKDSCRIMAGECPDAIPPRDLAITRTSGTSQSIGSTNTINARSPPAPRSSRFCGTSHGACVSSGFARQTGIA